MNGLRRYLIIGALLLIAYMALQYYKPKPLDWRPTYLKEDKIPYGTYILYERLPDLFPNAKVSIKRKAIYNTLKEDTVSGQSNYLLVAPEVNIDKLDYAQMVRYMQKGNHIFIAASRIKGVLFDTLKTSLSDNLYFKSGKKYAINFVNPALRRDIDYYFDKGICEQYFAKVDTSKATVLSMREGNTPNFVRYTYGKGALYILPNPELFSNFNLLRENGSDYAAKALSYLPNAERLIWDEYFTRPDSGNQSPLRVLFKYDQLRWAYYITLFSLIVFVLFDIKRRQRIIPIISRPKNTSVEFVETVGRVYYQQRNNRDIADKKINYWLEYLRNKYRLRTVNLNEEFKETLLSRTGATAETIEALFVELQYLSGGYSVSDQDLIRLNKLIEQFYKQDQ